MCPHCGKNAPVVNRGLAAYCTACGRARLPFANRSVTLAGKPSKLGGTLAGVLGWLVLIGGSTMALLLGLLAAALFPNSIAGLVIGLPLGLFSMAIGVLLLVGGRKLTRSGTEATRDALTQAIHAIAAHRGRALTAQEVGLALDLPTQVADDLLTQLAKERPEEVTVDISDRGDILYGFPGVVGQPRVRISDPPGFRVEPGAAPDAPRARVDPTTDLDGPDEAEELGSPPKAPRHREPIR